MDRVVGIDIIDGTKNTVIKTTRTDGDGNLVAVYHIVVNGALVAVDTIWDSKGDIVAATGPDAAVKVPVGSNGQVLVADSTQTAGVKWAAIPGGGYVAVDTIWDAKGDLAAATGPDAAVKLPVGSNGQVLTADSTQTTGLKWATPAAGTNVATDPIWDSKGDLAAATGADAAVKLVVGTNGQVLTADSSTATGLKWATPSAGGDPSLDTMVWMPLTTITDVVQAVLPLTTTTSVETDWFPLVDTDGSIVLDGDGNIIPTALTFVGEPHDELVWDADDQLIPTETTFTGAPHTDFVYDSDGSLVPTLVPV